MSSNPNVPKATAEAIASGTHPIPRAGDTPQSSGSIPARALVPIHKPRIWRASAPPTLKRSTDIPRTQGRTNRPGEPPLPANSSPYRALCVLCDLLWLTFSPPKVGRTVPGEPLSVPRPNVSSISKSPLPEGVASAILYCPCTTNR